MKSLLIIGLTFVFATGAFAQGKTRALPSASIKTLDGKVINTANFDNEGAPTIISFWATWCSPCKRELNTIAEDWDDWVDETGVRLIAISIDDARNMAKVKPYINGQSWDYDVYLDPNGDFKRAMNVNNVPHTFLLNGKNEIVWQHNSYTPGDEEELRELVQKLSDGESIDGH